MDSAQGGGSSLARGFGLGLGGCVGLLAIPVIVIGLGLYSCSNAFREARENRAVVSARPTTADVQIMHKTASRDGRKISVSVPVLNDTGRWLISAQIQCDLTVAGAIVGRTMRGVQQMVAGEVRQTIHFMENAPAGEPVDAICLITSMRVGVSDKPHSPEARP